ncbi:MAG: sulfotransferase [Anaerolineae bacterium]
MLEKNMLEASTHKIVNRLRQSPFAIPHLTDFGLQETGSVPASEILGNEHITLYSLDFDTGIAVFVETPADLDLSQSPFMFIPQYDEAMRVLTVSFEMLLTLADEVSVEDNRLVFIHSTGRCGSTLASQIFAQIPGVINLSEPFVLPQLVIEKNANPAKKKELKALLKAAVLLLCKTEADAAWVIKEHSYALELTGWLYELFPQAKHLFLYRHAETWMRSCLSAFFGGGEMTADELIEHELGYRAYKERLIPPVAALEQGPHRTFAELMSIEWLSYMERHAEFCETGIDMLAIRYQDWKAEPQKTAIAMLEYCNCRPEYLSAVYAALVQDSQAGTMLAQDTVKKPWIVTDQQRAMMAQVLHSHPFIKTADYVAVNSLRV